MVGRSFPGPWFDIDIARRAAACHCVAGQDQIDPQSGIAPEAGGPVVPPAEGLFGLLELAKHVGQAEVYDVLERMTFRRTAEDRVAPFFRVEDIRIGRCDVEIIIHAREEIISYLIEQFQDPHTWWESAQFRKTGDYRTFRPVNAKLVVTPNATATKLAALDHRFAIRESVSQPLMVEAEKVISQKLESALVSKESVYSIMVEEAMSLSDY